MAITVGQEVTSKGILYVGVLDADSGQIIAQRKAGATTAATQVSQDAQDIDIAALQALTTDDVDESFLVTVNAIVADGRMTAAVATALEADLAAMTVQAQATYDATAGTVTVAEVGGANPRPAITVPAAVSATPPTSSDADWANAPTMLSDRQTTAAEMDRRDALQQNISDRVSTVRDAATAEATKYPNELAVRSLIDGISTGQTVTPFGATFATLPPVPATARTTVRFRTVLTADDIGTGTASAPQYPKGEYHNAGLPGDGWAFAAALGGNIIEGVVADFTATNGDELVPKLWSGKNLYEEFSDFEIDVDTAGVTAEFGKAYRITSVPITLPAPSNANKGRIIVLRNANSSKSAVEEGLILGGVNIKLNSAGQIIPASGIAAATRAVLVSNGSEYEFVQSTPRGVVNISFSDNNAKLIQGGRYTIDVPASGKTIEMPDFVFSYVDIMIGQTSSGTLRIEAAPDNDGNPQNNISYFDANGDLRVNSFYELDASKHQGQFIRIFADGGTGRWGFENLSTTPTNTDQAAEWVANQAYAVGEIFSWPEQSPADSDFGKWFNWRVETAIAENEFAIFDNTNVATVEAKLTRFGITRTTTGNTHRVFEGGGTFTFNPIVQLSNLDNDVMDWSTTDNTLDLLFSFNPALITVWKDYTGKGLTQPAAQNDTFTLPANSRIRATREGNAVKITLHNSESVATGYYTATDTKVAKSGDKIRLPDGITQQLSATPADGDTYVIAPFNSPPDWLTNTGIIDARGTNTLGAGQNIKVDDGSALMTLVYDAARTNYQVFIGGDAYDPPQRRVGTLVELNALDITTYPLGSQIGVTNDPVNNGVYLAVRDDNAATVPTRWEKQ